MKRICISDCSLRKAVDGRAHALLFREKVAMVKAIATLGVDAIELPCIVNAREDAIINKTLSSLPICASLVLPAGKDESGFKNAYESIKDAHDPVLKIELPVSTVRMEYEYRLKNAGMIERIGALCAAASSLCKKVEFCALDATRAEKEFLIDACREAEKNGACAITLCDETGEILPEEWAALVADVKKAVGVSLYVQTCDKLGMASACALSALRAGADGLKTCLEGEDCLTVEKAASVLFARGEEFKMTTGIDGTAVHTGVRALLKSLKKNSYTEEKTETATVFLDGQSSIAQIREAAFSLGYDLSEEDLGKVKESLSVICRKKDSVGQKEFEAIIASTAMQVPSTYHLESYTATSSNMTPAVSQVTLMRDGEKISGVASGDGPIDAAFLALETCIGFHYELDDFEIQSVTEGKEALGSSLVRLRHEGKLYSGNGISTDIVGASIRAYINALNKIVYEG